MSGSQSSRAHEHKPIDDALASAIDGEVETAMSHLVRILDSESPHATSMILCGILLGQSGRVDAAEKALRASMDLAVIEGSLARASAAACQMRILGLDNSERIRWLASIFARGSSRVLQQGATPPALPKPAAGRASLPSVDAGDDLVYRLELLVAAAQTAVDWGSMPDAWGVPRQPLFSSLDPEGLASILGVLELQSVSRGEVIIEQHQPGAEAFIVAQGEVEVIRQPDHGDPLVLARLGAGALFGEMALLSRAPRAAKVVACRPSLLLVARREVLDAIAAEDPRVGDTLAEFCRHRMIDNLVRTSPLLRSVPTAERASLIQRFVTRVFEAGQCLISQGQESDGLHLVASGEVVVVHRQQDESTVLATLTAGEVVGEMALVLRRPSSADVVASVPTVTLHLPRDEFLGLIRAYPGMLGHLYELAVEREAETSSIVAREAEEAGELILV